MRNKMQYSTDYIQVLTDSLRKKISLLDTISQINGEQKQLAAEKRMDLELFEETVKRKSDCIDELNKLDDGFQLVYDRVKPELQGNSEKYKAEIRVLKQLISEITEKSMAVQAEEERNKQAVAAHFATYKKEIRQVKASRSATTNYYKSMNKLQNVEPVFMDKKK
ncbi:MAG: flagellar protein FlgN [Lachnospiraceae bacterium]|nr:flagellar protein FlgN [Lachnospiraceae bacterium]